MVELSFGSDFIVGSTNVYNELNARLRQIGAMMGSVDSMSEKTPPATDPDEGTVYIVSGDQVVVSSIAPVGLQTTITLNADIPSGVEIGDSFYFKTTRTYSGLPTIGIYTIADISGRVITIDDYFSYSGTPGNTVVYFSYGDFNNYFEHIAHFYDGAYHFYTPSNGIHIVYNEVWYKYDSTPTATYGSYWMAMY